MLPVVAALVDPNNSASNEDPEALVGRGETRVGVALAFLAFLVAFAIALRIISSRGTQATSNGMFGTSSCAVSTPGKLGCPSTALSNIGEFHRCRNSGRTSGCHFLDSDRSSRLSRPSSAAQTETAPSSPSGTWLFRQAICCKRPRPPALRC